jgi:hypothetical protein
MQKLLCCACLLLVVSLAKAPPALAQDAPSTETLRAVVAKLPHRPQTRGTTFQQSGSTAADPVCKMQRFTMTMATGSSAAHSVPVLLNQKPTDDAAPVELFAVLHRLTVDADGSPRTYHPDDPHGTGTCTADSDGHYHGVCALDDFASAHLLVFQGSQKLGKGDFEAPWKDMWPLIRDKKLPALDLSKYVSDAPTGYYFFYWKQRGLIALFKREIIPQAPDGFPCMHDGYFVAATTLKQDAEQPPNRCSSSDYMDAEKIPFLVLPDDGFGNAHAGDIVVARLAGAPSDRIVYGIVGDTGPIAQFGEASVAFNRALLGKDKPIMNDHDVDALDINGPAVAVLVLGGTKSLLAGDYSPAKIEAVGQQAFSQWSGSTSDPARRLDACVRQYGAN